MRNITIFVLALIIGLLLRDYLELEQQPAPRVQPRRQEPDPLIDLTGIGPVFEQALNELGIHTFAQLAQQDADALAEKLGGRVTGERIRRERWIEQAQERG